MLSFYIPTVVICSVYLNIFAIGRKIEEKRKARENKRINLDKLLPPSRKCSNISACDIRTKKTDKTVENGEMLEIKKNGKTATTNVNLSNDGKSGKLTTLTELAKPKVDRKTSEEHLECVDRKTSKECVKKSLLGGTLLLPNTADLRRKSSTGHLKKYSSREKRFVFIISLVMGCFMVCWTPFFTTYLLYAVCFTCCINRKLFIIFFWIGYLNSGLNPILYTIFNKDLRDAFKRLYLVRKFS